MGCWRWPGGLTFVSLFLMVVFLRSIPGTARLEKEMAVTQTDCRRYIARTSGFAPMPPRGTT